ncbi:hypothetical protein LWI29_028871 [Acer saccharum]|uniref:Pectinesterase inhibitor domain-containing protein n=1 Tax=Acer saccharum TaxID=4024 RepID=A0AA39W375_ACESA|nr:hypothetical protein LWI29_028871 [Acer saccharum]
MPHHNPSAISHNTQITANPFYMAKMAQYMTMVAFACTIPYHKLKKFYSLIQHHLINLPPSSKNSTTTIRTALEDCSFLASLNIDFLSQTLKAINSSTDSTTLESSIADDSETFLSATLTNQETCFDGLPQALESSSSSSTNNSDLLVPLVNGTKSFSVSLAIFKHGWLRNTKRSNRKVYETVNGRLLLQQVINISSGQVVNVSAMVVVKPDGSGNFTTINEAVAAAPNNTDISKSNGYFMIYVVAGVYEEYVSIPSNKKYLMMVGDGINQTVITGNRSVVDGSTTFNSATFAVVGQGFVGVNMTIRNTAGAIKHQAVAVRNGADMSTFYNCSFEGYQDTLYPHSLRQFYRDCDVYGTVDFIFGNAAVVLQNCNIHLRLPMQNQFNAITAQGRTDPNQNTGISIHNCTIKADDLASNSSSDISSTKTYLGRPWKEYSRTVYMETFMDSSGWKEWSGDFALSTLYCAEYNNTGSGSNTANRVTWPGYHVINETNDAVNFTVSNFIQGNFWLPAIGVPFIEGPGAKQPEINKGVYDKSPGAGDDANTETSDESEDNFSDIDDFEVDDYLHNEEEKRYKKIIWEEMNREYLEEQAAKEAAAAAAKEAFEANYKDCPEGLKAAQELAAAVAKSKKEKQQKRNAEARNSGPAATALEATRQMLAKKRLGSKINYDALKDLFEDDSVAPESTKKQRTESHADSDDDKLPKSGNQEHEPEEAEGNYDDNEGDGGEAYYGNEMDENADETCDNVADDWWL